MFIGSTTVTRRGRSVRLGLHSPEGALLKLHCYGLDEERLWEVMSAMALNDKVMLCLGSRSSFAWGKYDSMNVLA